MYTIALRPACLYERPNQAMVFEQETASWQPAHFKPDGQRHDSIYGLYCHSPLESLDISITELATLLGGLEDAYNRLSDSVYGSADDDLRRTPWVNRKTFMACVPRGIFEAPPRRPMPGLDYDVKRYPFLHHPESDSCIAWNGRQWVGIATPANLDSNSFAGICFGWDIYYNETAMSTADLKNPEELSALILKLLESIAYLNSDAKVYTFNLHCAQ